MLQKSNLALKENSPYSATITREQFLFYEMRTTAKLVCEGLDHEKVAEQIVSDNLFQYPTEKSVRKMALACLRRLDAMEDQALVAAIADQPSDVLGVPRVSVTFLDAFSVQFVSYASAP